LDPNFAGELASFARTVAERYPWARYFTPVNEPLTTARFSGLYGHWYPHARDTQSFARALLHEVRATALAMDQIRRINPDALLVQTEDIGTIFSSESLEYQAAFENQRRWLALDLLAGTVDPHHELFGYLTRVGGIGRLELKELQTMQAHPDIIGVNYYVTSDRFLDERLHHYPAELHGTNGRHAYADVEAVRVHVDGIVGHRALLERVWERYKTPLAITEVHLGCTEPEQVLWLNEAWRAAQDARQAGIDVRAVTAWALFGAFDWNSLVTRCAGHYEPGAFDVRFSPPKPTRVADAIRALASGAEWLQGNELGWWRRPERLLYPVFEPAQVSSVFARQSAKPVSQQNGRRRAWRR
jgi:dTDP-4-dehydrorhamnose reductase